MLRYSISRVGGSFPHCVEQDSLLDVGFHRSKQVLHYEHTEVVHPPVHQIAGMVFRSRVVPK